MSAIFSNDSPHAPMTIIVVFNDGTKWEIDKTDISSFNLSVDLQSNSLSSYSINFDFIGYESKGF